jgi:hypothetical protein
MFRSNPKFLSGHSGQGAVKTVCSQAHFSRRIQPAEMDEVEAFLMAMRELGAVSYFAWIT